MFDAARANDPDVRPGGTPTRFSALIIDRQPGRMAEICREMEGVADIGVRGAVADIGLGIVSAVRYAPDCVLLGWDSSAAFTADIASMLRRIRESLCVVVVTTSAEEQALARANVVHACACLTLRSLALDLPGVLAGKEIAR